MYCGIKFNFDVRKMNRRYQQKMGSYESKFACEIDGKCRYKLCFKGNALNMLYPEYFCKECRKLRLECRICDFVVDGYVESGIYTGTEHSKSFWNHMRLYHYQSTLVDVIKSSNRSHLYLLTLVPDRKLDGKLFDFQANYSCIVCGYDYDSYLS